MTRPLTAAQIRELAQNNPRPLTQAQIRERAQLKAKRLSQFEPLLPSPTIESKPLRDPKPKVHREEIVLLVDPKTGALDPKTSKQKRDAARAERRLRAHERDTESPMTVSGLNEKQRRHQKMWLKREGMRLRGKQQP
jgi:hypothetical protein